MKKARINSAYKKAYINFFNELLKESEDGYYDECALPSYTHRNKFISWLFWERIVIALSLVNDFKDKSVLDFGCGGGVLFKYFNDFNCKITGCDNQYYKIALSFARSSNLDVNMYHDLFDIKNNKFDLIFALDVLEHVDDVNAIIDKFYRLSHEKTLIVLSGPTENILYKIGRRIAGFSNHYHKRNIYDIEKKLKEKGYKNISMKKLFPVFTLFRISSWSK